MQNQNDTLFGRRILPVKYEDGHAGELEISQLKLRQYQQAFPLLDDEIGLVALCCGKPRGVIEALHPDSYEAAHATMKEVNGRGFFIFAARAMERASQNLRALPPEMLEKIMARGLTSSPPSRPLPPPAG